MEVIVKSGVGSGNTAEVTTEGKISADAVVLEHIAHESEKYGNAFLLSTGFISLTTTGSFNGILYIKNTDSESRHLFLQQLRVCGGLCAAASTMQVIIYKNPTAGTLISDANDGFNENANSTSSNLFGGDVYVASGDGKTVTDGTHWSNFQGHAPGHSTEEYRGSVILGKNDTLAVVLKPSVAMDVCMEAVIYFKEL